MSITQSDLFYKISGYDYICFDLDNTLLDTYFYDYEVFKLFFKKSQKTNLLKHAHNLAQLKRELPYGSRNLLQEFQNKYGIQLKKDEFLDFYRNPPRVDIFDKFQYRNELENLSQKVYLITNGRLKVQENKIRALGIEYLFQYVMILSPNGKYQMKPHPESFHELNLDGKTVFVGDSKIDFEYAKNCNIDFIRYDIREE